MSGLTEQAEGDWAEAVAEGIIDPSADIHLKPECLRCGETIAGEPRRLERPGRDWLVVLATRFSDRYVYDFECAVLEARQRNAA